jgi:hypothetical protein
MRSLTAHAAACAAAWANPCGCGRQPGAEPSCALGVASWAPSCDRVIELSASDERIADGGGVDSVFRSAGIVKVGDVLFTANKVSALPTLTCCYPKSIVAVSSVSRNVTQRWSLVPTSLGHDFNLVALACGADRCREHLFAGDAYGLIYRLDLAVADPQQAVSVEWTLRGAVGEIFPVPGRGLNSLAFDPSTNSFIVGVHGTGDIYVLNLEVLPVTEAPTPSPDGLPMSRAVRTAASGPFGLPSPAAVLALALSLLRLLR